MKVLISDKLSPKGIEVLQKENGIVVDNRPGISHDELLKIVGEYDALLVRSATTVDRDVIEQARCLKVIGRAGIGVDNIDVEAATDKGIVVMNTPGGNTVTTAEHTFSMMISLAHWVPQADTSLKQRKWEKKRFMGVELNGKTLGIIGLGRIGKEIARRALGFSLQVIAYDPVAAGSEAGIEMVTIDQLLARSDFITVHTPLTEKTRHMIDKKAFAKMKDGVRILNCARGGIINETDLEEAINNGKVAGAALDVFECEPPPKNYSLLQNERVIATPHLGASTHEAQENVSIDLAHQVADMLVRGVIVNALNVPTLSKEALEVLRPYMDLAELLTGYCAQLISRPAEAIEVTLSGQELIGHIEPLIGAVRMGYLRVAAPEKKITVVNAPGLFRQLGIQISETHHYEDEDYANLIRVRIKTDSQTREVAGTIIADRWPRIISIDSFKLELTPSAYTLVVFNNDKPGVIGNIGTVLGESEINIAGMQFGREEPGGNAIIALSVDASASKNVLEQMESLPNINGAYLIKNSA
jgi:D-3-phosphoglycerate dehydrogenase